MSRPETGRTGARFGAPARRSRHTEDPDSAHGVPVEPDPAEAPDSEEAVGVTGARFGGRGRKTRKERQAQKEAAPEAAVPEAPEAAESPDVATPEPDDTRPTVEMPRIVEIPGDPGAEAAVAVRPYVLTGGRTKVRAELRIETMVSTVPRPGPAESAERRTVLELCERPRSVSEVAALTKVPLGVARVLIDDLATEGRVRVHLGVDAATGPDMDLMNRVLAGLRRL